MLPDVHWGVQSVLLVDVLMGGSDYANSWAVLIIQILKMIHRHCSKQFYVAAISFYQLHLAVVVLSRRHHQGVGA